MLVALLSGAHEGKECPTPIQHSVWIMNSGGFKWFLPYMEDAVTTTKWNALYTARAVLPYKVKPLHVVK